MIVAEVIKDDQEAIRGFSIHEHGEGIACAAVSMLAINTINSIESFTEDDIMYEYNEESGGYMKFALTGEAASIGTAILLKSLELGLTHVQQMYPGEITVKLKSSINGKK